MLLRSFKVLALVASTGALAVACGSSSKSSTNSAGGSSAQGGTGGTTAAGGSSMVTMGGSSGTAGMAGSGGMKMSTGGMAGSAGSGGAAMGGSAGSGGVAMAGSAGSGGAAAGSAGSSGAATGGSAGSGGSNGMPSNIYPAFTVPFPLLTDFGGNVMASPNVYPVYFSDDDPTVTSKLTDFHSKLGTFTVGSSSYWSQVVSEYGVGALNAKPPIQLTTTAKAAFSNMTTIDDSAIQTWLAQQFNTAAAGWPTADDNTLVVLYFPDTYTITLSGGGQSQMSCQTFGGYHQAINLDVAHHNQRVAYAVLPRCGGNANAFSDPQGSVTGSASHEIVEAATDPDPNNNPAFASVDNDDIAWQFLLGGGEAGDLCAQNPDAFQTFGSPYYVQSTWSNKAAMMGQDPCVPIPTGQVYFNAFPNIGDATINTSQGAFTLKAVQIPVGQSKTIEVDLFSDGPTGPWSVEARDLNALMGGTANLAFQYDISSGQNGQKIHLTITDMTAGQMGGNGFFLISSNRSTQQFHLWPVLVVQ